MILGKINLPLMIFSGLLIVAVVGYFFWSQNELKKLNTNLAEKNAAIKIQENTITTILEDFGIVTEITKNMTNIERMNSDRYKELSNTLRKLDSTARARPGLVENAVNNASKERNRCIEIATGAKPLKGEKNRVCPHFMVNN